MTSTYRVLVQGLADGACPENAARRLAALFNSRPEQVRHLVESACAVVKKSLPQADAERYRQALAACGCRARIEEVKPVDPAAEQAFREWKELAEQGDAQAQNYVGQMYRDGEGTAPDAALAAEWFRRSAEQGNPKAQYNIGAMYTDGSLPPDALAAYRWIRIADLGGLPAARAGLEALEPVIPLRDKVLARIVARDWIGKLTGKGGHVTFTEAQVRSILPIARQPGGEEQADGGDAPVVRRVADDVAVAFTIDADGQGGLRHVSHGMLESLCMDADELYALAMKNRLDRQAGIRAGSAGAGLVLSEARLQTLEPALLEPADGEAESRRQASLAALREQLAEGDSRAAVVIDPVEAIVAAYSDGLDCVALLRFDHAVAQAGKWQKGMRLLAVNVYTMDGAAVGTTAARDLLPGAKASRDFKNFRPLIADLLTDDRARLESRKGTIAEDEWLRAMVLGKQAYLDKGIPPRDGRPTTCGEPARPRSRPAVAAPHDPDMAAPDSPGLRGIAAAIATLVFCSLMVYAGVTRLVGMEHDGLFWFACFGVGVFGIGVVSMLYVLNGWIRQRRLAITA